MAFELTINDFALVRELNFFFLTVTLALMALILVFAWSKDIYNGDTTPLGLNDEPPLHLLLNPQTWRRSQKQF